MAIELFTADDGVHGRELWRTDGAAAGTRLVVDLNPTTASWSSPANFFVDDGVTYFTAYDGSETQLYRTDGTANGTIVLTSPISGGNVSAVTAAGAHIFWVGAPSLFPNLYVSDGSAGGTTLLAGVNDPEDLVGLGDTLIFTQQGLHGQSVWVSDGTVAGTHALAGPQLSFASDLTLFKGEIYFEATDGTHGDQVWRTDGTAAGTQMVTDQSGGLAATNMAVAGGKLFFIANDLQGQEVWATDGTAAGTVQLTHGGDSALNVSWDYQIVGARLYFGAPVAGSTVPGLYVSDGTVAGTKVFAAVDVESTIVQAGGAILFEGDTSASNTQGLYLSAGTPAGTTLVAANVVVDSEANAGGKAFLEVLPIGGNDTQLWVSDGTHAGTRMLMDFQNGVIGGNAGPITAFGNEVLFSAPVMQANGFTTDQSDNELWISDGTLAGTHEVLNIDPPSQAGSLAIAQFLVNQPIGAALGNELVFAATVNGAGPYLMGSDGTQAGTGLLEPLPGHPFKSIALLTAVGGKLFFAANDGTDQTQLWVTNGVLGNATELTGAFNGFSTNGSEYPSDPTAFGGKLYFADGGSLWATDGTVAGTKLDVHVDIESQPVVLGNQLVFYGQTGTGDPGIYATNGEVGNLTFLGPPNSTTSDTVTGFNTNPLLAVSGAKAFFALGTTATGNELWVTDGTAAGTHLVKDIAPGNLDAGPGLLTAFDGGVVFTAQDYVHGSQVWFSDGTPAGTFELVVNPTLDPTASLQLNPNGAGVPPPMVEFGGRTWFIANDGLQGIQLWSSDGTTAGTEMLGPLGGRGGDNASLLTPFSGGLFFTGPNGNPWITDGTLAGTTALSTSIYDAQAALVVDGKLIFAAQATQSAEPSLFTTDGTIAGTVEVSSLAATGLASIGDYAVFNSPGDTTHAAGLYAYDVLSGATALLTTVRPLVGDADDLVSASLGGKLVFAAANGAGAIVPWVTDGTSAGTFELNSVGIDTTGFNPTDFVVANGKAYFVTSTGGWAIWSTDGTSAGTGLAATVADPQLNTIAALTPNGPDLYFIAGFGDKTPQLWDYNTANGHVSEVQVLSQHAQFQTLVVAGGELYFQAPDASNSQQLWAVAPGGAAAQLTTSANGMGANDLVAVGSKLFFVGAGPGGNDLFVTSGTAASTTALTSVSGFGMQMAAAGGLLYFQGSDPTNGAELWVSDGTVAGTHRVSDIEGPENANATQFTVAGGQVFFTATDGVHGQELWTFNGSPGGAHMVADIDPGSAGSNAMDLTAFAGKLYFLADGGTGQALWSSNGTAAGTLRLTTPSSGGDPSWIVVAGGHLFFYAGDSTHGAGLFETDGSSAPQFLRAVDATAPIAVGAELYFQGDDPTYGTELWKSDGTAAGTVRVTDTVVDNGSDPQNFTALAPPILPDNFNGDGHSDFLIRNGAGAVVVGESSGGAAAYTAVAALGQEWRFGGDGDLLDDGKDGFLIENAVGAVVVGEVAGGTTAYTQVAALGPEWRFVGTGNLLDGGQHDQFLIQNTTGAVVVGDIANGHTAFTQVAALGPEWSFVGVGDFLHDGKDQFLIENGSGAVVVSEVRNGAAAYTGVGALGKEWKFVGAGDFLGDGKDDFLIENGSGAVVAGELTGGHAAYTQLTALGPEWKFVGVGDYLGEGHDQFLIENASGAVVIGDWTGAMHFTQVAALGPEWVFH